MKTIEIDGQMMKIRKSEERVLNIMADGKLHTKGEFKHEYGPYTDLPLCEHRLTQLGLEVVHRKWLNLQHPDVIEFLKHNPRITYAVNSYDDELVREIVNKCTNCK